MCPPSNEAAVWYVSAAAAAAAAAGDAAAACAEYWFGGKRQSLLHVALQQRQGWRVSCCQDSNCGQRSAYFSEQLTLRG